MPREDYNFKIEILFNDSRNQTYYAVSEHSLSEIITDYKLYLRNKDEDAYSHRSYSVVTDPNNEWERKSSKVEEIDFSKVNHVGLVQPYSSK